jgi:hypothetical protein
MRIDPKSLPLRDVDAVERPRFIRPRALDVSTFPGWGPKLG